MNFFKKVFLVFAGIFIVVSCTKNGVEGKLYPTYVQLVNIYLGKTFTLLSGGKTIIGNIPYDSASLFAEGTPGFYSLSVTDSATGRNILEGNSNLQSGQRYSFFLLQDSAEGSDSVRYSFVSSDSIRPRFDSCRVRIFAFARNLPYALIHFKIATGLTGVGELSPYVPRTAFEQRRYLDNNENATVAQYFTLPTASTYDLQVFNGSGDTTRAVTSAINFAPKPQALYTFVLEGKYDSTQAFGQGNDPLTLKILQQ